MVKSIITLMAFLNFQLAVPQALYAQETQMPGSESKNSLVEQDFKARIEKLQSKVKLEDRKQQVEHEKKSLHEKKAEYKQGIQDDMVVLKARLYELNYLADFLDVDDSARQLVARSIHNATPKGHSDWDNLAAVSAIVMVPSAVVYGISKFAPYTEAPQTQIDGESYSVKTAPPLTEQSPTPEELRATTGFKAKTAAMLEATKERSARMYNSFRKYVSNPKVRTTAGVVALVSAVTTASALVADYYMAKPYEEAAKSQSRVYLSNLVTAGENDYLTYHQIDSLLTDRSKDESFGDSLTDELNRILSDTREKSKDIHVKQVSLMNLDREMDNLDQQLDVQKAQLDE